MPVRCGIVGLPNVGKSTLFNALTAAGIAAENFPFCTIEPNTGVVAVPEPRLDRLAEIVNPEAVVPTTVEFVDIAGLVRGASQGEGLGNQFLGHVRETSAIVEVVRCFHDRNVVHVDGEPDPVRDIETIETELALADLDAVERRLDRASRSAKSGDKTATAEAAFFAGLAEHLGAGHPAREFDVPDAHAAVFRESFLLTAKPVLYVANVDEEGLDGPQPLADALEEYARKVGAGSLRICGKVEAEVAELDAEDKREFLAALGLAEPGLHRLVRAAYALLDLISFFTAGPKEVRAWTVRRGATAPQAAGEIHSDFERGFIRAEVIGFADYVEAGGELAAKAAGLMRLEGKDYVVQDGDVIYFRAAP